MQTSKILDPGLDLHVFGKFSTSVLKETCVRVFVSISGWFVTKNCVTEFVWISGWFVIPAAPSSQIKPNYIAARDHTIIARVRCEKRVNFTLFGILRIGDSLFFSTPSTGQYEIPAKISRGKTCHQASKDAEAHVPRRRLVLSTAHPLCAAT